MWTCMQCKTLFSKNNTNKKNFVFFIIFLKLQYNIRFWCMHYNEWDKTKEVLQFSLWRACEASCEPCSLAELRRFCPTTLAWSPTAWNVVVRELPMLLKAFFKSSKKLAWLPAVKQSNTKNATFIMLQEKRESIGIYCLLIIPNPVPLHMLFIFFL